MNHSICNIDRATHLKIVILAFAFGNGCRRLNARHSFQLESCARREGGRPQSQIGSDCKQLNRRHPLDNPKGMAMPRKRDEAGVIIETFDPAFWAIATVLTAATVYLACLI